MTVTVQSALTEVQASARRLREVVRELVLTAVEDQPRNCQVHPVRVVHDAALEAGSQAEQADAALSQAAQPGPAAAQAVAHCQRHVTLLGAALVGELAKPELLNDLAGLGSEHGGEVSVWVQEVHRRIQACQIALWTDVQPALLNYWRELADITGRSCVSGDGR
ncbi:MAG TPA: hypothetical protein VGY50_01760 [Streptosporangiaceae bacterium]|jgi:hypothetical protein|nr:hypothetical protein [Streptosporangiaceae bacterium]